MADARGKFYTILTEAHASRRTVSMYHQSNEADRFEVGFVEAVSRTDVTILCLTPRGEEDGRMAVRLEDITALEIDDPYSEKIQTLHSYQGSIYNREESSRGPALPSMDDQLANAEEHKSVVTVEDINGSRFTGFVSEQTDGYIEMRLINQYGSPDGIAILARHMLGKVDVGRREEQTRAFLYKVNHELKRLLEP
ncbi:MAG TPA: hypothetical protein VMI31_17660 [Fimbriimonadaceae bacterium]|nr:hypothetical protein [Fimbriimonadaceae bacterium]